MGYVGKIGRATTVAGVLTVGSLVPMNAADIPVISNAYNAGHVLNINDLGKNYALAVPPTPTPGGGSVGGIADSPYVTGQNAERNDDNDVDWPLAGLGYGI